MAAVIPRKKGHDRGVSLPEDIVFDVIVRVPAKDLRRFRCVCKAWYALISDPAFVDAQRSRAGPHLVAMFCRAQPLEVRVMDMESKVIRVFEVQLSDKDGGTNLLGVLQQSASTGLNLICGLGRRILQLDTSYSAHAMIINLTAGHACAVDTETPLEFLSFGRTALSGAFKVLMVTENEDETGLEHLDCYVATIPHDSKEPLTWRQRSAPPTTIFDGVQEKRATVKGIVYFIPAAWSNSGSGQIAGFDLESEEWNMINGPAFGVQDETGYTNVTLTELKGTLSLVQVRCGLNGDHYHVIIWLLIDPSKSLWKKEYDIQMPKTWGLMPKQLWALDDGRILFVASESEKSHHHRLVFYNPSTIAFTKLTDIEIEFGDILALYTGSLLC